MVGYELKGKLFLIFLVREDDSIVADLAPAPPSATPEQTNNSIQITLANFQEVNVSSK
jgi:hypothetical protein